MHSVLGAQKGAVQPAYLVFYINTLLEKKQLDDADNWLQTLERTTRRRRRCRERGRSPNLFDTVRLRAEYQFLRGNYKAAGNLAMAFLDNPDAQPQDRGQQLLLVAQAHGNIQRSAQGGRQAGRRRPVCREGRHALRFPAEQESLRDGRHLLRRLSCPAKADPRMPGGPGAVLGQVPGGNVADSRRSSSIHSKAADAAQYRQLEKILVAAANKSNHPIVLLPVLAAAARPATAIRQVDRRLSRDSRQGPAELSGDEQSRPEPGAGRPEPG